MSTSIVELARRLLKVAGVESHLSLRLESSDSPSSFAGEPATLTRLMGKEQIRQFSLDQSLRDMWEWQVQQQQEFGA
jgi:hypothetical protein